MKIAVWHNLPSGGGKRALFNHVRGLVERGHTVEAWCPPTADQTYLPLSDIVREHVVPLRSPFQTRWQQARRKLSGGLEVAGNVAAMQEHSQECARQIEQGGFDVLLANSCQEFAAPFIGRHVHLPKALYLQEPFREFYEARPELAWIALDAGRAPRWIGARVRAARKLQNRQLQAREELTNARAFDRLLVNSYFSRESLLRAYNLSAQVCYLGIDTGLFQGAEPPEREDFVVGIGSFQQGKNIGFVVDALAAMPAPRPRLVWIGNSDFGGHLAQMQARAQAGGVELEARLRASDAEIVGLLHRAFAMVYAPRLEPFGYAPLEANACGLPVVAVAEGGVRETVRDGETGLLVAPDPQAMAAAVGLLRRDPAQARALGWRGQQVVREQWSVAASVDRLERHLAWLCQKEDACPRPA